MDERSCCDKVSHELNEIFCKPKARCFKGLAILCGIYALCCGLMLMIIPPVVKAHKFPEGGDVDHDLHNMVISTIILLIVFASLAVVNFLTCKVFEKREGRRESIINGQLMHDADNLSPTDFNENDFEER